MAEKQYYIEQLRPDLNEPLFALRRGNSHDTIAYLKPEELYRLAVTACDSYVAWNARHMGTLHVDRLKTDEDGGK